MSEVQLVSRRGFLGSMFSAGALILAARVLPMKAPDALAAAEGAASPWSPSVYLGLEPSGAVLIVIRQLRVAAPFTCTVQAPHSPTPHPYLVPVNCNWSRRYHSSGISGSPSNER